MKGDTQLEDHVITKVTAAAPGKGWELRFDSMCFWCPPESPIEPQVGMTARLYGRGFGHRVRGLVIDGRTVFYRTEAEDAEHSEIELYGADAKDWLSRWDEGRSVWSIEMGGLGPGYEQAIQVTVAEVVRHLLGGEYTASDWENPVFWQRDRELIAKWSFGHERIKALGLSGAQWGAALSLATAIWRDGPRKVMKDPRVKDRHIQVCRTFPAEAA